MQIKPKQWTCLSLRMCWACFFIKNKKIFNNKRKKNVIITSRSDTQTQRRPKSDGQCTLENTIKPQSKGRNQTLSLTHSHTHIGSHCNTIIIYIIYYLYLFMMDFSYRRLFIIFHAIHDFLSHLVFMCLDPNLALITYWTRKYMWVIVW